MLFLILFVGGGGPVCIIYTFAFGFAGAFYLGFVGELLKYQLVAILVHNFHDFLKAHLLFLLLGTILALKIRYRLMWRLHHRNSLLQLH